uniref:Ubiquinol oxidase n=1 Tax=Glycine max TaxID=3847 RepID=A0A0R0JTY5_SOYBN
MKLIALSSTVRRALLNGRNQNCNRLGSAAETRLLCAGGANGGFFYWKRTMASPAEAKFPEKEKAEAEKSVVESSYWGISRPKVSREDGTEWPWNCFMVRILFLIRNQALGDLSSNVSIDLTKHHVPKNFLDKVAYRTVKLLRIPTDLFFKRRYGCRAMMLETVAAVPGMPSGGWIKALLEEAENERMHLMTMVELVKPKWYERLLVLAVQGVFFNAFFVLYILSPKVAHRIVGYLEEEAIHSYTEYLKDLESGAIENVPAPAIAIDYWRLPKDAKLKDVVTVIRADEAHHRDVNHFASDIHFQGKELRDAPAPVGYH